MIHGNQTGSVPNSYQRYLEKIYRRELKLVGTPVRIEFKTGDNPYADKRSKLTERQVQRKRRLMTHVKKSKKKIKLFHCHLHYKASVFNIFTGKLL